MSTTRAREVLQDFLKSDFDEVLALKGKWGTGKTYTWVHLVNSAASDNQIAKPNYAYVSLFGINSLESLKNALFENTIESELIKDGPSLHTVANNFTKIFNREEYTEHENSWLGKIWSKSKPVRKIAQAQAKKSLPHIENLPILKDFFPFLRSASFLSVRNTIICIDDFERKGDSLNAKDIFGLITVLKEQRNCKVAIILNDDSLQGDEAEAYSKYREKVIDIELTFEPSAEECADLIFYGDSKPNKLVKEKSIKLNIKNIRILQRIKRLTDNINHELEQYDDEVAYNVFHGLTLMGWCFYSGEGDAPPLDYIKELSYQHHGLLPEEKKITDNEKSWNALLRSYDYQTTDELDLELAKYVEQGYYDVEDLHDKLKKLNDQIIANKSGNSFTQAWEHYHNTFADNADELIETLKDRLIENARHISPRNLNGTVTLFRELGKEELADELIQIYIQKNEDRTNLFSKENHYVFGSISDPKIREIFNQKAKDSQKPPVLIEVLTKIVETDGWGGKDEEFLSQTTADQYYELFKSVNSENLSAYIDRLLQFGRYVNASDRQKQIADNTKEALKRIAQESKLNSIRVKKFGIKLDSESET